MKYPNVINELRTSLDYDKAIFKDNVAIDTDESRKENRKLKRRIAEYERAIAILEGEK
jgi:hypothetical protein